MTAKSRKAHPASVRKQAAAKAYKQTFGSDPVGRYTAAGLERRVANFNAQNNRLKAMDRYFKTDPLSAGPAQSSKPLTTWDVVSGNTQTEHYAPSRAPAPESQSGWSLSRAVETVKNDWTAPPKSDGNLYLDDHVSDMRSKLTKGLLGVGVGVAAVQGYRQARDDGSSVAGAAVKGAVHAIPQAAVAFAPQVEKGGQFLKEVGYGGAKAIFENYTIGTNIADGLLLDHAIGTTGLVSGGVGMLGSAVEKFGKVAGKYALPAALAMGAVSGAMKDENRLRGAGRGMISALDPTGLFMKKGLAERGYDAVFGEQDRPQSQQPRLNRNNPNTDFGSGKGSINVGRHNRADAAPARDRKFDVANASYEGMQAAKQPAAANPGKRGWANPVTQAAAKAAQGKKFEGFKSA